MGAVIPTGVVAAIRAREPRELQWVDCVVCKASVPVDVHEQDQELRAAQHDERCLTQYTEIVK